MSAKGFDGPPWMSEKQTIDTGNCQNEREARTGWRSMSGHRALLLCGVAAALSAVSVRFLPGPFVFLGVVCLVTIGLLAWGARRPRWRFALVSFVAIVLALTVFEAFLWLRHTSSPRTRFAQSPAPSAATTSPASIVSLPFSPSSDKRARVWVVSTPVTVAGQRTATRSSDSSLASTVAPNTRASTTFPNASSPISDACSTTRPGLPGSLTMISLIGVA